MGGPTTHIVLQSLSPAYLITCADAMEASLLIRKKTIDPVVCQEAGEKLLRCYHETVEKLAASPCNEIQQEYLECIDGREDKTGNLVKCKPLAHQLRQCTAKHIGKLD